VEKQRRLELQPAPISLSQLSTLILVTKLADRGSVESVGGVTDVGLFLNLLRQRLIRLELEPAV
jgi:hypothetical protein